MKHSHVAGDIELVEFGRYDKTDTGDDYPLIEITGCNFGIPLVTKLPSKIRLKRKNIGLLNAACQSSNLPG